MTYHPHSGNTRQDFTGRRFGRLFVVRLLVDLPYRKSVWECRCDCGVIKSLGHANLSGSKHRSRSCGCLAREARMANLRLGWGRQTEGRKEFAEAIAECINRFPQTSGEIKTALRESWGEFHERRFWRELARLLSDGIAIREGPRFQGTYRTPKPAARVIPPRPMVKWLADREAAKASRSAG